MTDPIYLKSGMLPAVLWGLVSLDKGLTWLPSTPCVGHILKFTIIFTRFWTIFSDMANFIASEKYNTCSGYFSEILTTCNNTAKDKSWKKKKQDQLYILLNLIICFVP